MPRRDQLASTPQPLLPKEMEQSHLPRSADYEEGEPHVDERKIRAKASVPSKILVSA